MNFVHFACIGVLFLFVNFFPAKKKLQAHDWLTAQNNPCIYMYISSSRLLVEKEKGGKKVLIFQMPRNVTKHDFPFHVVHVTLMVYFFFEVGHAGGSVVETGMKISVFHTILAFFAPGRLRSLSCSFSATPCCYTSNKL